MLIHIDRWFCIDAAYCAETILLSAFMVKFLKYCSSLAKALQKSIRSKTSCKHYYLGSPFRNGTRSSTAFIDECAVRKNNGEKANGSLFRHPGTTYCLVTGDDSILVVSPNLNALGRAYPPADNISITDIISRASSYLHLSPGR